MKDYAKQIRAKLIQSTPADTLLDIKRRQAIAYLGENWVHHLNYKYRQRHAFQVSAWAPHSILRPVQLAAMKAGRI